MQRTRVLMSSFVIKMHANKNASRIDDPLPYSALLALLLCLSSCLFSYVCRRSFSVLLAERLCYKLLRDGGAFVYNDYKRTLHSLIDSLIIANVLGFKFNCLLRYF